MCKFEMVLDYIPIIKWAVDIWPSQWAQFFFAGWAKTWEQEQEQIFATLHMSAGSTVLALKNMILIHGESSLQHCKEAQEITNDSESQGLNSDYNIKDFFPFKP